MVAAMFGWLNLPGRISNLEKGLTQMATKEALNNAIAQLKEKAATEKAEVNAKIAALSAKVDELTDALEAVPGVDLSEQLALLAELGTEIETIYVPDAEVPADESLEPGFEVIDPAADAIEPGDVPA